ncbi:MAG: DUF6445 family protein [Lysobacterales bacterium]
MERKRVPSLPELKINPALEINLVALTDRYPVAVIDDFLLEPGEIVDYACVWAGSFSMPERAYPGRVLPVPNSAMTGVNRFIQAEMSRVFAFCRGGIEFYTQLSMTTLQPRDFTWIQRLCHTDPRLAGGRRNFAALLYLFDNPALGGTGFYRWKDPAFWAEMSALQQDDPADGLELLQQRYALFREPPRYMTESNEAAELIDKVPARFNRLIFYSGELPHSAWIEHPELLTADPATGRLTLNCFASVVPKH